MEAFPSVSESLTSTDLYADVVRSRFGYTDIKENVH